MVYFPELFSNRSDKFARLAIWLITKEAVVCPNVRNIFTAGGKGDYLIDGKLHINVPRIFLNLFDNLNSVVETLQETSASDLTDYLNQKTSAKRKIGSWIDLVHEHAKTISAAKHINLKNMLDSLIFQ